MKAPSLGSISTVASSRETWNQELFYVLAAKLSSALGFARSLRGSPPPPPTFLNTLERLRPRNEAIERGGIEEERERWHRAIHAWSINSNEGSSKDCILDRISTKFHEFHESWNHDRWTMEPCTIYRHHYGEIYAYRSRLKEKVTWLGELVTIFFLITFVNFNFYLFNQPLFINLFIRFIFTSINILIIILIFAKKNRKAPSYFHRTTANTQRIRTIKSGKKAITFDPVLATRRPNLARGGVVAATADGFEKRFRSVLLAIFHRSDDIGHSRPPRDHFHRLILSSYPLFLFPFATLSPRYHPDVTDISRTLPSYGWKWNTSLESIIPKGNIETVSGDSFHNLFRPRVLCISILRNAKTLPGTIRLFFREYYL